MLTKQKRSIGNLLGLKGLTEVQEESLMGLQVPCDFIFATPDYLGVEGHGLCIPGSKTINHYFKTQNDDSKVT